MQTQGGLARELRDGVLWLAFDRPRASNAIDFALAQSFAAALEDAALDPAVGAVVMTGSGAKVFSAGIDIKNPDNVDHEALSARRRDTVGKCLGAVVDFEKPLVAAVDGPAIGLAWMLVLLADRVIASARASFSLPEIDIGIPTFLGISIVTRAVGAALAREVVLTGRRVDAAEAKERGLIARIESNDQFAIAAQSAALALAAKPKAAFALDKRWLARGLREEFAAAGAQSQAAQPLLAADKGAATSSSN
jgi:enoyl-CoA hydratase/carnithine racemase